MALGQMPEAYAVRQHYSGFFGVVILSKDPVHFLAIAFVVDVLLSGQIDPYSNDYHPLLNSDQLSSRSLIPQYAFSPRGVVPLVMWRSYNRRPSLFLLYGVCPAS